MSVLMPGEGPFSEALQREGIRHFCFPAITKRQTFDVFRLVRSERIDLVYANNTHSSSRIAFIAARAARARFVCHVRGMAWRRTWRELGHLRLADGVIAVSRACAESVRRFVSDERLHVVHNGVSITDAEGWSEACSRAVRAELGVPASALMLVSVSHLSRRKGQLRAVEMMHAVRDRIPSAQLYLVGRTDRDPEYTSAVREAIKCYDLEGRVHILGYREDVSRLLSAADLFVHTAVADPHPRAVIEAMAAELPVVAYSVDGVAETVEDGVTGILVSDSKATAFADAVAVLASSPGARRSMGVAGRARVQQHFTDKATADRIEQIIADVLGKSGCR